MFNNSIYAKYMWKQKINLWLRLIEIFACQRITTEKEKPTTKQKIKTDTPCTVIIAKALPIIIRVLNINKLSIEHCIE